MPNTSLTPYFQKLILFYPYCQFLLYLLQQASFGRRLSANPFQVPNNLKSDPKLSKALQLLQNFHKNRGQGMRR